MNYKLACENLGIATNAFDNALLKKHYHMKALLYHPDKNSSPDAARKFQEMHDSYEFLIKCETNPHLVDDTEYNYQNLLHSFLNNILQKNSQTNLFQTIIHRIVNTCEITALDTIEKLDTTTLRKVYDIIKINSIILNIGDAFIKKIENILTSRVQRDECIILNPTIDDLFENNLYKLTVNDFTYIVPLWHHELVYDNSGCDIYIKCFPMLNENISIDNKNNIIVFIKWKITDIWGKKTMDVYVGSRMLLINIELLKIISSQQFIFAKQGISKINTDDVFNVSKKGDIIVNIELTM
jgi:hypothetical protein